MRSRTIAIAALGAGLTWIGPRGLAGEPEPTLPELVEQGGLGEVADIVRELAASDASDRKLARLLHKRGLARLRMPVGVVGGAEREQCTHCDRQADRASGRDVPHVGTVRPAAVRPIARWSRADHHRRGRRPHRSGDASELGLRL